MDLKQLTYLLAVRDAGSFTKAANGLHIAQPAISMAIAKLELRLFDRQDRNVRLTPEGEVLCRHAERLLLQMHQAEAEMAELKGLERGEVRIGIPYMMGSYYFPPILMAFKHRYPGLKIRVEAAGSRELLSRMVDGTLDLAILITSDLPPALEGAQLLREEMLMVVGEEHPLRYAQAVSLTQFFDQELAMFRRGFYHREHMEALAQELGCEPDIAFESNLIPLLKAVVKQGFAVTTFLRMVLDEEPSLTGISFAPPIFLDLCVAWRRGDPLSMANRALRDFLLAQAKP
ncbi:LysR family transcriptional regulator [Aeromonas salmonicida subsp. salmonicida]|uniref:Transcriptional regulator, LysR family n=2 Tax=Aeromonas salmonicida subsp. salmonicida TaxID=29491 RepID=A4SLS1_AERS4|nr:LysR substrate-binding domain-containing protein [Aeromonas salmonicida]ABO89843.1 transcriptional regulator, LysR family [Aeromonas salmonicida subsp. salmonicida A449]AYO62908.1 LysR family transcriptional regulator [Aeromonas salmonicida subsp. salmonicida 01-B526]EHI52450.1 LysR family transcriptional regulator [Aeromonas salmonicida subsp. salmonicida 01-B526]EKP0241343.1 LysR family transcriptional regulator [Aeromonas salmonicida]EKP0245487.1 LysR family transcriptional regulator [Ae